MWNLIRMQDIVYAPVPWSEWAQKEDFKLALPEEIITKDRLGKPIDLEAITAKEKRV